MTLLLVPHAMRHLGLLAIVPEVVGSELVKTSFAQTVAFGDAIVAPFALVCIILWSNKNSFAKTLTWILGVAATIDVLVAILGALTLPVVNYTIGAFWLVLILIVPMLLVSQYYIFKNLKD